MMYTAQFNPSGDCFVVGCEMDFLWFDFSLLFRFAGTGVNEAKVFEYKSSIKVRGLKFDTMFFCKMPLRFCSLKSGREHLFLMKMTTAVSYTVDCNCNCNCNCNYLQPILQYFLFFVERLLGS